MQVLIAGGGIGGLAAAIALGQRGVDARVFEAAARGRDQGAGIILAPNALAILKRLELYERARAAGFEPKRMIVARSDGTPIQTTEGDEWRARYGFAPVALHRAALHALLLEAAGDRVRHDAVVGPFADEPGEPVRLQLSDGTRAEGDLVVGADGLRSPVRRQLFGDTPLRYAGQTSWRGIARLRLEGRFGDGVVEMWGRARGLRFGVVPIGAEQTYWFATAREPAGGGDRDHAQAIAALHERLREFVPETHALLDATERLIRTDIFDFAPLTTWHRGRVVLLGDAAHATTPNLGQGACQAIESAFALGLALAQHPLPEALQAYERSRMAKAHWVTRQSWRFGQLTNVPGALGRWLRYDVVARASKARLQKMTDRLFALDY